MAKEYITKDGKKILGWYRRGGKAIPIIEGQGKKGDSDVPKDKDKGEPRTNERESQFRGMPGSVIKEKKVKSKARKENALKQHEEYMAKEARREANKPSHVKEAEREKFVKDYYDTMMKAGKTADKVRQVGNDALWRSATASNDDDIKAWQNRSNKTEDVARFIEGREPVARIASKLIEKAKSHADEVTKDLQDSLKGDAGSVDRGLPFRTKGQESMHRKLREKSIAKGLQPEQYADKVTDALRFTDMVDADNYVGSFNKLKKGLEDRGYEMVEVENTIHKKGEKYRGLNTLVESPKGYTFELQFHTPESFDVKEVNHKDYEVERRLTTSAEEKERLSKQMADRANKIQTPKGAETIQDVPRHKRKGPSDSAIRNVMEERGMTRTEAVLYLKKKNKYE